MSVAHFASGAGVARRTTAQRTAMVPTRNSLIYDTDALDLYVGDGTTIGGQPAPGSGAPVTGVVHSVGNITESIDGAKTFTVGITAQGGVGVPNGTGFSWADFLLYQPNDGNLTLRDTTHGVAAVQFIAGASPYTIFQGTAIIGGLGLIYGQTIVGNSGMQDRSVPS